MREIEMITTLIETLKEHFNGEETVAEAIEELLLFREVKSMQYAQENEEASDDWDELFDSLNELADAIKKDHKKWMEEYK